MGPEDALGAKDGALTSSELEELAIFRQVGLWVKSRRFGDEKPNKTQDNHCPQPALLSGYCNLVHYWVIAKP